MTKLILWLASALLLGGASPAWAGDEPPIVLAAASLQESLTRAGEVWAAHGHLKPVISFAASSALARQVEAGVPADIFISADEEWMDAVARKGLIRAGTRVSFLGNRLVLIAPTNAKAAIAIKPGFPLAAKLGTNRLAVADPDAVPAGKYAKSALITLGVWPSVEEKLARAENVRAALAFVERSEAPYGIVYETDAKASKRVRIAGYFPTDSYPRISYPIALLKSAKSRDAEGFRRFLISPAGNAIFRRFGFKTR